jgi:hypothetical protein
MNGSVPSVYTLLGGEISYTWNVLMPKITTLAYTNAEAITLANAEDVIALPQFPMNYEKHIIIDGYGAASGMSPITINDYGGSPIFSIEDPYGAVTLLWVEDIPRWFVIAYYPISSGPVG